MEKYIYRQVVPFSRKEAKKAFASKNDKKISEALVGLAYFDSDWEYVKNLAVKFLTEGNRLN